MVIAPTASINPALRLPRRCSTNRFLIITPLGPEHERSHAQVAVGGWQLLSAIKQKVNSHVCVLCCLCGKINPPWRECMLWLNAPRGCSESGNVGRSVKLNSHGDRWRGSQRSPTADPNSGQKLGGLITLSGLLASHSMHVSRTVQSVQLRSARENAGPNQGVTRYPASMPRCLITLSIFASIAEPQSLEPLIPKISHLRMSVRV